MTTYNQPAEILIKADHARALRAIAMLADQCRRDQNAYFALRTHSNLVAAKQSERRLHAALAEYFAMK